MKQPVFYHPSFQAGHRRIQVNMEMLEANSATKKLIHISKVNLLGENINGMNSNEESGLETSKK